MDKHSIFNPPAEIETDYEAAVCNVAERLKEASHQRKVMASMIEDQYAGDTEFSKAQLELEEKKLKAKKVKFEIQKTPEVKAMLEKLDDLKDKEKDLKGLLSAQIEVMFTKTGKTEIKTPTGKVIRVKKAFSINANQLSLF